MAFGCCLSMLAVWLLWVFAAPFVTMWAFNTVVTGVFHGPGPIDYWQAFALNVLISLVTGGLGFTTRKESN